MLKCKSPSHTAKRGTADVVFGVGLVPIFPISRLIRHVDYMPDGLIPMRRQERVVDRGW